MVKLTESIICGRTKAGSIEHVKKLNCWGCDLDDVSILENMPNLEILSLSVNRISTLQPLSSCFRLKELYMRSNCINDLDEILHLQRLNELRILWLTENPCAEDENYRNVVLRTLPRLTTLDNRPVTAEEVSLAQKRICPPDSPEIISPNPEILPSHSSPIHSNAFRFEQLPPVNIPHQNGNGYDSNHSLSSIVDLSGQMEKKVKHEDNSFQNLSYETSQRNVETPSDVSNYSYHSHVQRPRENSLVRQKLNENVLSAVVLLLDELDDRGLSIVISESEKRLRRNF